MKNENFYPSDSALVQGGLSINAMKITGLMKKKVEFLPFLNFLQLQRLGKVILHHSITNQMKTKPLLNNLFSFK